MKRLRVTIIHPCVGRKAGQQYIRTWQMEPLPAATLAGLTPRDVEVRFYDDRMELIPFDEATDLVAISVETYTAKRAYQIASEYRRRKIPVVMGGFHASLCPDEVACYAESVVVGEAEQLWPQVLDDARHGTLQKFYRASGRTSLTGLRPDRSIFAGKRYLPVGLVEAGRGCHFTCEFCAVQTVFESTQSRRPIDDILAEIRTLKDSKKLFFFVDDNITSNLRQAKEFFRALIPLGIRWVSQASINAAHDEEFLDLLVRSGCQGVLIGFESLNPANLESMNKRFNTAKGGFETALANLRRHKIRVYGTFIFGYDGDTAESFMPTVDFAERHAFYIAAFNHLTPFPGTPLYKRLQQEGRLLYDAWWIDDRYSYNRIPFQPRGMSPDALQRPVGAAPVLRLAQHHEAQPGCRQSRQRLHVAQLLHDQCPASAGREPARSLSARRSGVDGTAVVRELNRGAAARVTCVSHLQPHEEGELRQLLRRAVLPGHVRVAFTREPNYFAGEQLAGASDHTVVARVNGAMVGVGRCSVHTLYRNGAPQRIGYLGELRVTEGTPGSVRILRDGFAALSEACANDPVDACFTSIATDNTRARRVLEHGARLGLPPYRSLAPLVTLVAPVARGAGRGATDAASQPPVDHEELTHFLATHAPRRQLTLSWDRTRWEALANHGIAAADLCVVRHEGAIVGAAAVWNQTSFRQTVIDGYTGVLRLTRPLVNAVSALVRRPGLPPAGSVLAQGVLLGATVASDAHWPALWWRVHARAQQLGLSWLTIARDARDPELARLRPLLRAREYHTTLYDVRWPTHGGGDGWDARVVAPEVGLL
jgi:radical SAM superfamily enzyme YgiQ (UPF0313 family)